MKPVLAKGVVFGVIGKAACAESKPSKIALYAR
jgi:hypothetical protein